MKNPVSFLRQITLIEAISFLLLVGIAMPLKYHWGMPQAVRVIGAIHGGLFLLFCLALMQVWRVAGWPMKRVALIFAISFLPLVPFFYDRRLKEWAESFSCHPNP